MLLSARQGADPGIQATREHSHLVVAEMAQQPPEPLGAASSAVHDDEDSGLDTRTPGDLGEGLGTR